MTSNEWDRICEEMEREIPELHKFLETWGPNCGASRATFRGHLCKMLRDIAEVTTEDESNR